MMMPLVMKAVMFCDSNYATDRDTIKSVSGGTLLTCLLKTHSHFTLKITEAEFMALSEFSQEVKFVSMFLVEISTYKDNQGTIFLAKNMKVGICTKYIDICHHFLWDIVEDKDIDIKYIRSEDNPAYIRTNNI